MKRIAIVLNKNIETSQALNAAAIIMGMVSNNEPSIYGEKIIDMTGVVHSSIMHSTVILKGGINQIKNLALSLTENESIVSCVFTLDGQQLNDDFDSYKDMIEKSTIEDLQLIALGLCGDYEDIKRMTKKFSVWR